MGPAATFGRVSLVTSAAKVGFELTLTFGNPRRCAGPAATFGRVSFRVGCYGVVFRALRGLNQPEELAP